MNIQLGFWSLDDIPFWNWVQIIVIHHALDNDIPEAAPPISVQAPILTLPPVPILQPSLNFQQVSHVDLESPLMDTAVVMVQPLKRPPVQRAPPGIPPTTFRNTTQSQMSGLTPSQQAQAIANPQQQAILANDGRSSAIQPCCSSTSSKAY